MARIKNKEKTLDDEFKNQPLFTPQDLKNESLYIHDLYSRYGSELLRERYLYFKKVVGVRDRKIVCVLDGDNYTKFDKIFDSWAVANLPKTKIQK